MSVSEDIRSETFQTTDPVTLSLRIQGGQIYVRATETAETHVELEALNDAAREIMPRVRLEGLSANTWLVQTIARNAEQRRRHGGKRLTGYGQS